MKYSCTAFRRGLFHPKKIHNGQSNRYCSPTDSFGRELNNVSFLLLCVYYFKRRDFHGVGSSYWSDVTTPSKRRAASANQSARSIGRSGEKRRSWPAPPGPTSAHAPIDRPRHFPLPGNKSVTIEEGRAKPTNSHFYLRPN